MALYVKTGTYAGNSSGVDRAITGIGFQPEVVILKTSASSTVNNFFKIPSMPSGESAPFGHGAAMVSDAIKTLDSDGFTVGTYGNVNTTGVDVYWTAIGGTSSHIASGSYTGDGTDDRDVVTGLSFQPDYVSVKAENTRNHVFTTKDAPSDTTLIYTNAASVSNAIQVLNSDGFQIGTSVYANQNAVVYYWFALKTISGIFETGNYTGNGVNPTDITAVSFLGDSMLIGSNVTRYGVYKNSSMGATEAASVTYGSGLATTFITAFLSNGFTVTGNSQVNQNTSTYYWMVFKDATASVTIDINDTFVLSDSVKKTAGKNFSETLSLADSLATLKSITKSISDSINLSDTVSRITAKVFTETINLSDSINRTLSKILSDTLSLADSIANIKVTLIAISDSINLVDSFGRGISKVMSDTVALAEDFMATATKVFTDTISLADSAVALSVRFVEFIDTITLSDIMNKSNFLRVMDTILLVDEFRNRSWTRRVKPAEGTWTPRTKPPE